MTVVESESQGMDATGVIEGACCQRAPMASPAADSMSRPAMGFWDRAYLWTEFVALYALIPLILLARAFPLPLFPLLLGGAGVCLWLLRRDRAFDRTQLWNWEGAKAELPRMLGRFVLLGGALAGLTYWLAPGLWLGLVRERPWLWGAIMLGYPVLSVLPQNVIWRTFLMHRYRDIMSPRGVLLASAAAFGFVHVLLENWLAVGLTMVGGVLFAHTYQRSRSMLAASIEHALYGCLIFTIGIGKYLVLNAGFR